MESIMKGQALWAIVATLAVLGAGTGSHLLAAERAKERTPVVKLSEAGVNINAASEAELGKLKGVGRATAKRIIEYREANGDFKKPEDIRNVEGIGKRLWEQNRDRILVK